MPGIFTCHCHLLLGIFLLRYSAPVDPQPLCKAGVPLDVQFGDLLGGRLVIHVGRPHLAKRPKNKPIRISLELLQWVLLKIGYFVFMSIFL